MGANLKGQSPLQEVRIDELLAKDKVGIVRFRLKEVWNKSASPRTETPYKAQPEDKQAQHERSPTDLGQGKWRGCAEEVCALIWGDLTNGRFRALALRTALCRETGGEIGQESAEAVVAIKSVKADGAKG